MEPPEIWMASAGRDGMLIRKVAAYAVVSIGLLYLITYAKFTAIRAVYELY